MCHENFLFCYVLLLLLLPLLQFPQPATYARPPIRSLFSFLVAATATALFFYFFLNKKSSSLLVKLFVRACWCVAAWKTKNQFQFRTNFPTHQFSIYRRAKSFSNDNLLVGASPRAAPTRLCRSADLSFPVILFNRQPEPGAQDWKIYKNNNNKNKIKIRHNK